MHGYIHLRLSADYGWSDGTPFDYLNWADAEPNNDEERCVEMYAGSRRWNDQVCDSERGYVCKAKKSELAHQS